MPKRLYSCHQDRDRTNWDSHRRRLQRSKRPTQGPICPRRRMTLFPLCSFQPDYSQDSDPLSRPPFFCSCCGAAYFQVPTFCKYILLYDQMKIKGVSRLSHSVPCFSSKNGFDILEHCLDGKEKTLQNELPAFRKGLQKPETRGSFKCVQSVSNIRC